MTGELEFLYQALTSQFGIVLSASNASLARQRLYQTRAKIGDPQLARLQFRLSPYNQTEIWLVKGPLSDESILTEDSQVDSEIGLSNE